MFDMCHSPICSTQKRPSLHTQTRGTNNQLDTNFEGCRIKYLLFLWVWRLHFSLSLKQWDGKVRQQVTILWQRAVGASPGDCDDSTLCKECIRTTKHVGLNRISANRLSRKTKKRASGSERGYVPDMASLWLKHNLRQDIKPTTNCRLTDK